MYNTFNRTPSENDFLNYVNRNLKVLDFESFEEFYAYINNKNMGINYLMNVLKHFQQNKSMSPAAAWRYLSDIKKMDACLNLAEKSKAFSQKIFLEKTIRIGVAQDEQLKRMFQDDLIRLEKIANCGDGIFMSLYQRAAEEKKFDARKMNFFYGTMVEKKGTIFDRLLRNVA